jgi:hypothetical protein
MAWALHAASRGLSNKSETRNTASSRPIKKRRTRTAVQLRATICGQSVLRYPAVSLNARLRYGRRGETTSPHGAGMPAVPALARLTWCAVASLQASQPCGPLRCVTLAGCVSGGSRLCATVEFGVRRLRLKKWRRVKQSRHALAFGKRVQK